MCDGCSAAPHERHKVQAICDVAACQPADGSQNRRSTLVVMYAITVYDLVRQSNVLSCILQISCHSMCCGETAVESAHACGGCACLWQERVLLKLPTLGCPHVDVTNQVFAKGRSRCSGSTVSEAECGHAAQAVPSCGWPTGAGCNSKCSSPRQSDASVKLCHFD